MSKILIIGLSALLLSACSNQHARRGDAFERADKAVYHAKQNGRNQVADHAALVASGGFADASRDSDVELF